MNIGRTLIAVSLEEDRLFAVSAVVGADRVRVRSWLSLPIPGEVDAKDASAVGAWLGRALREAGLGRAPLVLAVPRGDVVLKRLRLPRPEGASEADLAGMVRLQMTRQLAVAIDGTAIDYAPVASEARADEEPGAAPLDGPSAAVLAGALPGDRMAWYRGVAKAAGAKIARVGLKAAGAAALMADVSQRRGGPVLGIAVGWKSTEFVVVEDGHLVFARAADIGVGTPPGEDGAFVSRLAVEAKRTWMSYRVGQESAIVDGIAVLGDGETARQVGLAAGEALEMPWELVGAPAPVELPPEMPEADRLVAAPLIGLLAERLVSRPTLDFAHPRRAPDLAAIRRQRVLLAVLLAIVVGGGLYVLGQQRLADLERRVALAEDRRNELEAEYVKFLAEEARLRHVQEWRSAQVDWLAHAAWLSEQMPDPRQALLDSLRGEMAAPVEFVSPDGTYGNGRWQTRPRASFAVEGRARQREVANDLRGRLVASGVYGVDSRGPDTPDRFSFQLTTALPAPAGWPADAADEREAKP